MCCHVLNRSDANHSAYRLRLLECYVCYAKQTRPVSSVRHVVRMGELEGVAITKLYLPQLSWQPQDCDQPATYTSTYTV